MQPTGFPFRLLLAILLLALPLTAQIQNAQLSGTVADPAGAALAGATVTVTNAATGFTQTLTTNNSGFYVARELPPGTYTVRVEAPGFKTATRPGIVLNAGVSQRADIDMQVGAREETVEVTGEVPLVNTEDSKPYVTVNSTQIENLPLNGRNVFSLMTQAPGAVNVEGVSFENGGDAIINGVRENFNGFLLNGVSNKGLSGGFNSNLIQDSVQEFQLLTMNMSAQYGNSAGAIVNVVSKSGTNDFHGSAWYFHRNEGLDANRFFINQLEQDRPGLNFNQYGVTFGGPLVRDKLFFFGSFQRDQFIASNNPEPITVESPGWRQAVISANPGSVAALLYSDFPPGIVGTPAEGGTLDEHIASFWSPDGGETPGTYVDMFCAASVRPGVAGAIARVIGILPEEITAMNTAGCDTTGLVPIAVGTFGARSGVLFHETLNLSKSRQTDNGNLFHGNEASGRIDYNFSEGDRVFAQYNWLRGTDEFFGGDTGFRGFTNPDNYWQGNAQFSYTHTFSPTLLNEFRAGYASNREGIIPAIPGVPAISFADGGTGFGSYNGYPQIFREHIYTFSDMVSVTAGKHNFKIGFDARRNMENSEFNVGRPSYIFFDQLFFAADAPYYFVGGVDPGFVDGEANLATNIRHWRNWEYGAYVNDDWKITRNLTLNLGLRYDLYQRHSEADDLETTFRLGPGEGIIGGLASANIPAGAPGCDTPEQIRTAVLAGVCGPGGFDTIEKLGGPGDHNNFGPRVGFAWDVFGDGKTSLRGGAGVSFEGTFYNAMSNSRWNPPFYSFNQVPGDFIGGFVLPYGPQDPSCGGPRYTGDACPANFQGFGATAVGNIMAYGQGLPNGAFLTGIVLPTGIRDPYVMNWFLGLQREILPKWVAEINYVATGGRKLFRAEDINRIPGGRLPDGTCVTDNFGRQLCSQRTPFNRTGRLNPNYGRLRTWLNSVNSSYNSLQTSLRKQMGGGLQFAAFYTWSHSIDAGSTWHSGATTANGAAAGEGFSLDQTLPELDRGNSIFDIRHVFAFNWVWELPFFRGTGGPLEWLLGGWKWNGTTQYHTGAHFSFWDPRSFALGGDYNLDRINNDRPNVATTDVNATHDMWANGWGPEFNDLGGFFTAPCTACTSNQGRNNFVGPDFWNVDSSISKSIKFTERVGLELLVHGFNVFNRTNFQLPDASDGVGTNQINNATVGKSEGTFNARNLQVGARITF
jgi:hypothetical protein